MRECVAKAGLGDLHLQASHVYGGLKRELKQPGIDRATMCHLRAAQNYSAAGPAQPKIIFLSAWNEWTGDPVLPRDAVFGCSYLEAVRRVFRG